MESQNYLYSYIGEHPLFQRQDLLTQDEITPEYEDYRRKRFAALHRGVWDQTWEIFAKSKLPQASSASVVDGRFCVGVDEGSEEIEQAVKNLIPWRKGPFRIGATQVDSEWRSDYKYERMLASLSELSGARVADVGSGNGYYAFRLLLDGASHVICFDPSEKFFFQFELLQRYFQSKKVQFEIAGYEEAAKTQAIFDIVLCMGVLYHQKNPMRVLECCRKILKPRGTILVESMVFDHPDSMILFPEGRYAKARNVYFLPSIHALRAMIERSGYEDVHVVSIDTTDVNEQRTTQHMPFESLIDFLDPKDRSKTIEGYPAPMRAILRATRKRDH